MQQVAGFTVTQTMTIAMAGMTKVYIGEIIEEGMSFAHIQLT